MRHNHRNLMLMWHTLCNSLKRMWWCWTTQVLLSHASKLTTHDQVSTIPPCLCLLNFVNLDFSSTSPYTDLSAKLQFLVMPFPRMCKTIVNYKDAQSIYLCIFWAKFLSSALPTCNNFGNYIITYENLTALKIQNAHICSNIYFNKCNIFAIIKWAK